MHLFMSSFWKEKFSPVFLSLSLGLSIWGCSSQVTPISDSSSSTSTPAPQSTPTPTPTASPTPTFTRMGLLAGVLGSVGFADGTGASARFHSPEGMYSDGTNLYVVDYNNSTIRKIVISTGVVTTLAGSPGLTGSTDGIGAAARFNTPLGIVREDTNLYVTDTGNSTIRKIDINTGAVTTFAGSAGSLGSTDSTDGTGSTARFNGPNGIASDGTYLYVADTSNSTIRKIALSTGAVTTLAGSAGLSYRFHRWNGQYCSI